MIAILLRFAIIISYESKIAAQSMVRLFEHFIIFRGKANFIEQKLSPSVII